MSELRRAGCYAARRTHHGAREVLLTQRAYVNSRTNRPMSSPGEYVFPGGHLEGRETEVAAAIREFREELVYGGEMYGSIWFHTARQKSMPHRVNYRVQYFAGFLDPEPEFSLVEGGEVIAYQWLTPQDALDLIRSDEFNMRQLQAFEEHCLADPRHGIYAVRNRRMPVGTMGALEVLINHAQFNGPIQI